MHHSQHRAQKCKLGVQPRAPELRSDTFTFSTLPLEQRHCHMRIHRNISPWDVGSLLYPKSLPGTQAGKCSDSDTPFRPFSGHTGIKDKGALCLHSALVNHLLLKAPDGMWPPTRGIMTNICRKRAR